MYKLGSQIYADAGNVLKSGPNVRYQCPDTEEVDECAIDLNEMVLRKSGDITIACCDKSQVSFIVNVSSSTLYADTKAMVIESRYSHADQIAILCNKEDGKQDHIIAFERMQAWRNWASEVATKITDLVSKGSLS